MANKQDKYMQGRNDGMAYALRIVEEKGVDGLREEIKFRGISGINLCASKSELEKTAQTFKEHAMKFSILIALVTLYDDFYFSNWQGKEFSDKYYERVEGLARGDVTMAEYVDYCKENLGLVIDLKD